MFSFASILPSTAEYYILLKAGFTNIRFTEHHLVEKMKSSQLQVYIKYKTAVE